MNNGDPVRHTDAARLAEREKLGRAAYAWRRCTCAHPLGLVDEDGETTCFWCGWPFVRGEVSLPPGAPSPS